MGGSVKCYVIVLTLFQNNRLFQLNFLFQDVMELFLISIPLLNNKCGGPTKISVDISGKIY